MGQSLVDFKVTNPDGQFGTATAGFAYVRPPVISSISPSSGPSAGGTTVTIIGTDFTAGATVLFGANPATNVQVAADGLSLTCVTPHA